MAEVTDLSPVKCEFESRLGHMNSLLIHIKTTDEVNTHLQQDKVVRECMEMLQNEYPGQIHGYQWERVDTGINIMMWGNINAQH